MVNIWHMHCGGLFVLLKTLIGPYPWLTSFCQRPINCLLDILVQIYNKHPEPNIPNSELPIFPVNSGMFVYQLTAYILSLESSQFRSQMNHSVQFFSLMSWVWWCRPIIPAQEWIKQEDSQVLEASLGWVM